MSGDSASFYRSWAEIDLSAVRHNFDEVAGRVGKGVPIMAITKADAYGHGLRPVVQALASRTTLFGVANLREALEVRAELPSARVILLSPPVPKEYPEVVAHRFEPMLSSLEEAHLLASHVGGTPAQYHLKIDTGMGRIGVWQDDAVELVRALTSQVPGARIAGFASHLPAGDEDAAFTRHQLAQFTALIPHLRAAGATDAPAHILNSAGVIAFPEAAHDLVRPGIILYGSAPIPEFQLRIRPALTWKTRITLVRDVGPGRTISYGRTFTTERPMRLATLAVGYADGYRRTLSGQGAEVLIHGRRCPLIGRVTMDQLVVDVSALPSAQPGDEVVLLGRQEMEEITAAELGRKAGTIAWEIFTGITRRVERVYMAR